MWVDLPSLSIDTLDLPGGEHPRIQSVDPLMIIVDRPQLNVRFRQVTNLQGDSEPQIDWEVNGIHKLAYLVDDQQRLARGVLASFLQRNQRSFPRTAAPWVNVQDLFTNPTLEGIGWASNLARFPLESLFTGTDDKGLFFDYLHKEPWLALFRSRARLSADFEHGSLTVTELNSLVYDINHAQIGNPANLSPDASGENAQFAPFGDDEASQQSSPFIRVLNYLFDNTIGGSLVSDRDGVPYQFISYIDIGDGGLRVIYDTELDPPDAPPPWEKLKCLDPESVPGPGLTDECWIELQALDWQDIGLPNIALEGITFHPTITSSIHEQIESLLTAGTQLVGLTLDEENGWEEAEVNSIQTWLNNNFDRSVDILPSVDGVEPPAFIRIRPSTVTAGADTIWEALLDGEEVVAADWVFTPVIVTPRNPTTGEPLPPPTDILNSTSLTRSGNPATIALLRGRWTVHVDIRRTNGSIRRFEVVVPVGMSLFQRIADVHNRLNESALDPSLSAIGDYRIGTATFNLLQYRLRFPVESDELFTHRIVIETLDMTDAQWRFRANNDAQGLIEYRLRIRFESKDIRLSGLLSTLVKIERVSALFYYGRSFTPGILMNDTRTASPRTGGNDPHDGLVRPGETRLAAALTARPFGNAQVTIEADDDIQVKVSMLPQVVAAGVITLLIGLGAASAATTLIALVGALGLAIAAASAPVVGLAAAALAVMAAVAVFLFIALAVPPIVETTIKQEIREGLTSTETLQGFEEGRLLQFAGEGLAEAIARQIIEQAIENCANLEAPPQNPELIGQDRFRQDLFQMIHVSEGRCRVLIRTECPV